jgi:cytochrome o ubiquinol oxidase subunit 2
LAAVQLASCGEGVLAPEGPVARAELTILLDATAIMLAVILPVIVLTLAFAWWFRSGNARARYLPDWEYSGRIEVIVWAIPALVVTFLGGIAWISAHELDPPRPLSATVRPLEIDVVALDWKWLFIYPDSGVASVNRLVIPSGRPVHFRLTSSGVMNSFFVPRLGSQIYTMAGMVTQLNLMADRPGIYPGISAQFSGDGFSDMRFDVVAVTPPTFETWVRNTKGGRSALDPASYASLARPAAVAHPVVFASVSTGLFDGIVSGRATKMRGERH